VIATNDTRRAADVGRCARLELTFAVRRGRTVLADGYAEPPLRLGRCFEGDRGVHVILASSAPGVFGGDHIEQVIRVEAGAIVRLTSQSAMQLHPCLSGAESSIHSTYDVAEDAELTCEWHPSIPFSDAAVRQRVEVNVQQGGRLSWSDAMMSGREGSGERWRFRALDHELRVRFGGTLAYLERYRIEPDVAALSRPWLAGEATYAGTLLRVGMDDTAVTAEALHRMLASADDIRGSADVLDGDLLLVRIVAAAGVPFHRARRAVAAMLVNVRTGS
jgi:urease accessory protein